MKVLQKLLFACALFFLPASMLAQNAKAYEKAGDKAFAARDFYAASLHFQEAIKQSPEQVRLWFKYAETARQFNAYEEAENYYAKVWRSEEGAAFPMAMFWLGQVKKSLGKYQEAIEVFEEFLKKSTGEDYYSTWAKRELETCRWASEMKPADDPLIKVEHLDKKINSPYSEFGALEVENTLYYSSYRFDFPGDQNLPERKLTKVLTSLNLAKGKTMPKGFNDDGKHTAHTAFSLDGNKIYFTICEYVSASDIRCELFSRKKDKRGKWETKADRLPDAINLKGYTATHPSIGFDSTSQKEVLYFVSDRPNGKGKLDIWYCEFEKDKFLEPKNLEATNTPENDASPFFHVKSQTLYFSSEGHPSLGGYDIYKVKKQAAWGEITHCGVPVNSSYHDLYFSLNECACTAFLSSNRPGSFYLDPSNKACCFDLYRVTFDKKQPPEPGQPPVVEIPPPALPPTPPVPTTLEDFLPLALYFDNDEPDKRTNRTSTKKNYETTFLKYFERKPEYLERFTKPLSEEDAETATSDLDDFFENEAKRGYDFLQLFSNILLKRLENGERVEIVIKGYTSPRAKSDYNDNLAQRRISSLRNHFDTWRDGIFQPFLKEGKLVISEAPFGETKASTAVSDDLVDERNSIYSVGAAKERR
ncbi:MAG: hypothetical protein AAB316_12580, partial [Bacteroidota bacterium]